MKDITYKARELMRRQTKKNGAPVWDLTKTAVQEGRRLAKKYQVDAEVVVTALWLAHICFSDKVGDKIQSNHTKLSSDLAEKYLQNWGYPKEKIKLVSESILNHHKPGKSRTMVAEVMKNAECYKFITWPKLKLYYYDLLKRGYSKKQADKFVRIKFKQKMSFLTFEECIADAKKRVCGN